MRFNRVLDLTTALLVEVYRELGMKFSDIMEELTKQTADPATQKRRQPEPDNEASMALLLGMMGGSDFKGARG